MQNLARAVVRAERVPRTSINGSSLVSASPVALRNRFSTQRSILDGAQKEGATTCASPTTLNKSLLSNPFSGRSYATENSKEKNFDDASLLCKAASVGNIELLQKLTASGIDVNNGDYDKRTALHLAAAEGKLDAVRFLIEHGSHINSMDRFGGTPLDDAMFSDHQDIVKYLREHGAKPGKLLEKNKATIERNLIDASHRGDVDLAKKMLEMGADVNQSDYDMRTPLHLASAEGRVEMVKFLLSNGATVNSVDRFGNTPLHDALRSHSPAHQEVVKHLEEAGAALSKDLWKIRNTQEFQSVVQKSLPLLLERGNWEYTEVWIPNTDESALFPSTWYAEKDFVNEVASLWQNVQTFVVRKKKTFYGKVWDTKKAVWVNDVSKEAIPHTELLPSGSAFKSALGLPIVYNDKVLAVLGFFSTKERQEDSQLVDKFYQFSSGLIKAGIDQALTGTNVVREKQLASGEQMSVVYNTILEEGVFNGNIIYQELDWWYNSLGLQAYYFERFSPYTISRHLHSFIAAKKLAQVTGQPEDIRLSMQQRDGSGAFFLCPTDHASMTRVEQKVEKLIEIRPESKAYTLTFFRSKGTAVPNGSKHLGLYIFDVADYVEKDVPETETDIWKISTGVFLRDKTPLIRERYQDIIKRSVSKLSPCLEVFPAYRDGTIPLMFAFKMGANTSYLSTLTELLKFNDLTCERKFIETFANGMVVYSLYLHNCEKEKVQTLLDQVSLLHLVPHSNLTQVFLTSGCTAEEYAYASAVSKCVYYFLAKPVEEFKVLAEVFKGDPLNHGRLRNLQTTLRRDAISRDRIAQCLMNYPSLWDKLFDNFKRIVTTQEKPVFDVELAHEIKRVVANETDESIFLGILTFNHHVLKTNFFKRSKSSLSFRLDPSFMKEMDFPEIPYGLFFVMGLDFQGFHVRFRDVARGGIRLITAANEQVYNRNLETQFNETYNLAYTQNKKNKDIPEFGSKGTILLNWGSLSQKNTLLSFQKYVAGLMDLVTKKPDEVMVDHYGKEELLFLGPDEGTADYMKWAAEYSARRNYPFWLALTTGKPPSLGGVPHDRYGMTTLSVHRYVLGCLAKAGLKEEEVTKLQTGGPDGDLGSNEILMSKDKTVGVIDGSGVLYDPQGIDRKELNRLAKARRMVNEFDTKMLGPEGFRVLVSDRGVRLPSGEIVDSGFTFRNEFHLNPLVEADFFVPCGGRPESVNLKNVAKMFKKDGVTPRFKYVIEGANLFLTPDARMVLEQAGVVVYKDASTNKGGVTSSSLEVLAALAMSTSEHEQHMQVKDDANPPAFYKRYVEEIQERIQENANLEFECIWREHELTKIPRYILTDRISDKINYFNDVIQASSLWNESVRRRVMMEAFPNSLIDLLGLDALLERVPENYSRAIFGSYLASRYVYKYGLSAPEFAFFEFMQQYIVPKK